MKDNTIKLKIESRPDRDAVVGALVRAGYKVSIQTMRETRDFMAEDVEYVVVEEVKIKGGAK